MSEIENLGNLPNVQGPRPINETQSSLEKTPPQNIGQSTPPLVVAGNIKNMKPNLPPALQKTVQNFPYDPPLEPDPAHVKLAKSRADSHLLHLEESVKKVLER